MKKSNLYLILFKIAFWCFILFFQFSCKNEVIQKKEPEVKKYKDTLMRVNRYLVTKDAEMIKNYVKRRNLNMQSTKTGMWYMITQKGSGPAVQTGKSVKIKYKLRLLHGKLCYSSDSLGVKTFTVGQGGVERGLEEGILLLHQGDKAMFIIPPYLAYGLIGDQNCIPPRTIIMYDIELLSIE